MALQGDKVGDAADGERFTWLLRCGWREEARIHTVVQKVDTFWSSRPQQAKRLHRRAHGRPIPVMRGLWKVEQRLCDGIADGNVRIGRFCRPSLETIANACLKGSEQTIGGKIPDVVVLRQDDGVGESLADRQGQGCIGWQMGMDDTNVGTIDTVLGEAGHQRPAIAGVIMAGEKRAPGKSDSVKASPDCHTLIDIVFRGVQIEDDDSPIWASTANGLNLVIDIGTPPTRWRGKVGGQHQIDRTAFHRFTIGRGRGRGIGWLRRGGPGRCVRSRRGRRRCGRRGGCGSRRGR